MDLKTEIKNFLFTNSVINLLIAVVIGNAFANLILSSITNIIFPILGFIIGNTDLSTLQFNLGDQTILYGKTLNLFIVLIVSLLTLDFLFIKPFNSIIKKNQSDDKEQQIKLIKTVLQENQKLYPEPIVS